MRALCLLLLIAASAQALEAPAVMDRQALPVPPPAASVTHELRLTLAYLEGTGWAAGAIVPLVHETARVLSQCAVAIAQAELLRIAAPERFGLYARPVASELVRAVPADKPTIYFVADTRARPAFEAEAIGRGNSGARPELAGTVWITHTARDAGLVLAHELAHVLMDSGDHSTEPDNLMRAETAPGNVKLTEGQCARLRATGTSNRLLRPVN
jgi:hypothetical protein